MFLKHALGSMTRRLPRTAAASLVLIAAGCGVAGGGSVINDIIDAQLRLIGGALPTATTVIVLVNQTQATIELDLLIDGALTTVSCTPADARCEYLPPTCPSTVVAVQERRLDAQGAFVGGRNYDENPNFTFDQGDFGCDSTLVFTFTEDATTAKVL